MATIFNFITTITAMFTVAMYRGWIIVHFWQWFIMPTFPVKALSIPVALGISVFIVTLTHGPTPPDPARARKTAIEFFFSSIAGQTVIFGIGYIISRFM